MRFRRLMCFLQSLRPHFLCRHCDRKFTRRPPKPIASVVMRHSKKRKKTDSLVEKSLTNCPLFLDFWTILQRQNSLTFQLLLCGQFLADFLRKEIGLITFTTKTNNDRNFEIYGLTIRKRIESGLKCICSFAG